MPPRRRLYLIGGQLSYKEGCANQATVNRYDAARGVWEALRPLPRPLGHIAASTIPTSHGILIVGGVTNRPIKVVRGRKQPPRCMPPGMALDNGLFYDPERDAWESVPGMPMGASMVCGFLGAARLYCQRAGEVVMTTFADAARPHPP